MTFVSGDLLLNRGDGEDDSGYARLRSCEPEEEESGEGKSSTSPDAAALCWDRGGVRRWWWRSVWWWAKLILLGFSLGLLAAVFLKWVAPFFMDKEIIPILNWETRTFSTPVLALIVFASVALFPTILLPSTPSMWVAGMTFGYGYGFLLIIAGASAGVSLPFFIGFVLQDKIQGWVERYTKSASIIRLAGEGDWFNQLRAVTLIRISPFPYIVYNYCAMATGVAYVPYLIGSLIGLVPEIFVAIYTGIVIKTLADASKDRNSLSAAQIICTVLGFCLTMATTVVITIYAKRRLRQMETEEILLLQ
ncbi:unnamed protein product [Cuscuta campestris]|uniref:VTT domain-containing protein n=1 Tax=Cuscuta campestris TaxID=132261 RepID=A0A484NM51_9ASTE|nr:unnamed protein product [Cuscuta campestris]